MFVPRYEAPNDAGGGRLPRIPDGAAERSLGDEVSESLVAIEEELGLNHFLPVSALGENFLSSDPEFGQRRGSQTDLQAYARDCALSLLEDTYPEEERRGLIGKGRRNRNTYTLAKARIEKGELTPSEMATAIAYTRFGAINTARRGTHFYRSRGYEYVYQVTNLHAESEPLLNERKRVIGSQVVISARVDHRHYVSPEEIARMPITRGGYPFPIEVLSVQPGVMEIQFGQSGQIERSLRRLTIS